jgi:hypothetical protein
MLTAEGRVKIPDFGLAYLSSDNASRSGLTEAGAIRPRAEHGWVC